MKAFSFSAALVAVLFLTAFCHAVVIPTVPIGNPGNPADTRYIDFYHPSGVGSVTDPFRIGKTEITNAQYTEFLNAVAASDSYGLYNTLMGSFVWGGIVRSGASGSYTYAVKAPALSGTYTYDSKPVVYVSSGDAMRFANWLHNGQPTGAQDPNTTEDGAYSLNGAVTDAALTAVTRSAGARWWLPNEDEWYKAAYYSRSGVYYDYPTATNTVPNNNLPSSDTGNSANFDDGGFTTGDFGYPLTDAGAYTLSDSPYGTLDQGGNVWEWNDTPFVGSSRGARGGSWYGNLDDYLHASHWSNVSPAIEDITIGFRVATIPEPATLLIAMLTGVWLVGRSRGYQGI